MFFLGGKALVFRCIAFPRGGLLFCQLQALATPPHPRASMWVSLSVNMGANVHQECLDDRAKADARE